MWVGGLFQEMQSAPTGSNDAVYFSSVYRHGVDDKRRLQIPAKWRPKGEEAAFTLVLWKKDQSTGACLLALPPLLFAGLVARLTEMPFSDPKAEALRRLLGSNSDQVGVDKVGRMCLPEAMAQAAGISNEAVLVGMFDRFQIWSPDRHRAVSALDDQLSSEAYQLI